MINRIVALFGAVLMVCASPFSSAWDADSFVQDSPDYYRMFSVNMPSISTMADSSLINSFSLSDSSSWSYYSASYYFPETEVVPGLVVGGYSIPQIAPPSGYQTSISYASNNITVGLPSGSVCPAYQPEGSDNYLEFVDGICFASASGVPGSVPVDYFDLDFDLSSYGDFSIFSFDGSFTLWSFDFDYVHVQYGGSVQLLVNGSAVHTFESNSGGVIDFASFIYDASVPVTSIVLRVYPSFFTASVSEGSAYSSPVSIRLDSFDAVSFDVLTGDDVLNGYNDQAQSDIDSHEQVESEWVQTSSDNFAALDIENFSIPSSLLSGFALISGIFTDIWNGLGDYRVVFVLPLTLGVILVVVGRIARTAGSQSSRNKGGDGNA